MGAFAVQLSETALMWRRVVAPIAESVARTLWSTICKPDREPAPATRLTQRRKREVKAVRPSRQPARRKRPQYICRACGKHVSPGRLSVPGSRAWCGPPTDGSPLMTAPPAEFAYAPPPRKEVPHQPASSERGRLRHTSEANSHSRPWHAQPSSSQRATNQVALPGGQPG
jgi:hypothetical protein